MLEAIILYQGDFGRLSIRRVIGDLVRHAHEDVHIILWLDGAAGKMIIGNNKITPSKSFAIGVNSFEPHDHTMPANETGLFLAFYIRPDWAHQRLGLDPNLAMFADPMIPLDASMCEFTARLVNMLSGGAEFHHLQNYEIVAFIDRALMTAEADRQRQRQLRHVPRPRDFRIRKAVAFMNENLTCRMPFDEVARSAGLSCPHFFALFKDQMNVTPNIYWNMLRMQEALRHVQSGEEKLTEIAIDLGFTSQGNFSRFFREHVGVPPAVYRSAARSMGA